MNLQKEKEKYKEKLYQPSQAEIDEYSFSFTLFSANIKKFLPHVSITDYRRYFQETLYHNWISGLEQYDMEYLKKTKIINNSSIDISNTSVDNPLIFTSFHLGSYRSFISVLYELGHKIVLIIDESVFAKQQGDILINVVPLLKATESSDIIILNVMDRTSIFKLKSLIEQGYIMTVYLDGNTGINSDSINFSKSYIPIQFLNNLIYVKNGVGKLASLLNAKIIPVIAHRDEMEINHIKFYEEIQISDFEDRQEFAIKSIEKAYKLFEEELSKYPTQCECWLHIHKWFKRDFATPFKLGIINSSDFKFNEDRYSVFKRADSLFLFDLYDYQSYPINTEISRALENNDFSKIDGKLLEELKTKNVVEAL